MSTISASEARQTLPAQLDRVEAGEQVAITRHGRVVAILVHPDTLRTQRAADTWAAADAIAERLARARREPVRAAPMSEERLAVLIESVHESRSSR